MKLTARQIADCLQARYEGPDQLITAVSTDTRHLPAGSLFIALKGERFDGHAFVAKALDQGAALAVVMDEVDAPEERLLRVPDTLNALKGVAGLYRGSLDVRVVGITGSVGKTTTKEMVACVCEAAYPTLKTQANLNNEIGLSQMILSLEESHRIAVLEMGMDGPGQIRELTATARPDVGLITNIGVSHMEALGSREGIRDEKLDITRGMPDGGTLILPGDDPYLRDYTSQRLRVLFHGIQNTNCAVVGENIQEYSTDTGFQIRYNGTRLDARIPCLGRHNVSNALAAFCAGVALGIDPHAAVSALADYRPTGMRQNIVEHRGFTVVEDCYNASPDSMRAALETLRGMPCQGRRIAVLSDMLELGPGEAKAHWEVGQLAAACANRLLCTGPLSAHMARGAVEAGMKSALYLPGQEELFRHLKGEARPGDVIWVKASRGMHLEHLLERMYREL